MTLTVERTCEACGKSKTDFNPRGTVCFSCQAERKRERERARYNRDPKVRAKRRKNWEKRYKKHRKEILARRTELRKLNHDAWLVKQREYSRQFRARIKADPEKHEAYKEKYNAKKREQMKDPKYRQRANESRRISRRKKWEEEGRKLEPISIERYKRYNKNRLNPVDPGPLRVALEEWLQAHTLAELETHSGVDEAAVRRLLNCTYDTVTENLADTLCTTIGIPFTLLYPDEEYAESA